MEAALEATASQLSTLGSRVARQEITALTPISVWGGDAALAAYVAMAKWRIGVSRVIGRMNVARGNGVH